MNVGEKKSLEKVWIFAHKKRWELFFASVSGSFCHISFLSFNLEHWRYSAESEEELWIVHSWNNGGVVPNGQ